MGRRSKGEFEYRLRWDDAEYAPGELRVVAYKAGKQGATASVKTAGDAVQLSLIPDRSVIANDGKDLAFANLKITDKDGQTIPRSMDPIHFEVAGPGELVATDNGDPTDMPAFPSKDRKAFNGLALAIIRARGGQVGRITVTAILNGLRHARTGIQAGPKGSR